MLSKQQQKLKRMATLMTVLSKYGFKDVLARMNINTSNDNPTAEETGQKSVYVRIRMVLEELGPTFVKLGQAFSNREDILPKELIRELQQLQDNVELTSMEVHTILEDNFGADYREAFQAINTTPLASASIAQVYQGVLATGEKVVLKIKRPKITEVIEADLLLMRDLVQILSKYFEFAKDINLEQMLNIFEKSLLSELSFVDERENIERLAKNFSHNRHTYVPKVYPALCSNEVVCMEFIEGAKITDTAFHQLHQLDPAALADKGLTLYLTQILEHGFFHADPHAGNIFILPDGRIVFIDLGAMGTIYPADQEVLEDLIIHLITQNINKLVALLKKMAIRIEIKDETKLREDLSSILAMVNTGHLEDLNIMVLVNKFKEILFENKVIMPDYFTLLVRGLVLIESVGRTLNPSMDLIKSIDPYVKKVIQKRLSPQYLFQKGISKLGDFSQDIQDVPAELRNILLQLNEGKLTFNTESKALQKTNILIQRGFLYVAAAIVAGALLIAAAVFFK